MKRSTLSFCLLAFVAGCSGNDTSTMRYPNGNVKREVESRNGRLDGTMRDYSISGKLMKETHYDNGRLIGTEHCNRSDGDC